jgi:ligand-binding SRPBCC domain-containing protein
LGRDGGALQQMLPIFKLGVGAPLGNGKQWMSWIHIDDLVNIFSWAIKNEDVNGIYNAVAPSPVTNREFSKTLATMLSSPLFPSVPAVVLKLAMGEMSEIVLASQKVSAEKLQKSGFHFQYSNLKNAISALLQSVEGIYGRFADVFFTQQWLPHPVEKVFPFYSEAKNLERITPEFLQFRILSQSTPQIEKNSEFTYRLKVHGIPLFWRTKILEWEPNVKFVDNQESGPYSRWHHTHIFQSISNGTLISDRVVYKLPLGFLGYLIASRFVARDVAQIFGYRQKVVNAIFQK